MYIPLEASRFKEQNAIGKGKPTRKQVSRGVPKEDYEELPMYIDRNHTVTNWYCPSLLARFYFLFTGKMWMRVDGKQPAAALGIGNIFKVTG